MKWELFEIVVGTTLFVHGAVLHDINYVLGEPSQYIQKNAEGRLAISDSDADLRESRAYQTGIIGAGILALSIKHLSDSRKKPDNKEQSGRLRLAIDLFIGASFIERGSRTFDTRWETDDGLWVPQYTLAVYSPQRQLERAQRVFPGVVWGRVFCSRIGDRAGACPSARGS